MVLNNLYVGLNFSISPGCLGREIYWIVLILNSHVHDISTALLIPSTFTESIIHYGDLNWDTGLTQTRVR